MTSNINPLKRKIDSEPLPPEPKKSTHSQEVLREELASYSRGEKISDVIHQYLFSREAPWSRARIDQFFPDQEENVPPTEDTKTLTAYYTGKIQEIDQAYKQEFVGTLKKIKELEDISLKKLSELQDVQKWFAYSQRKINLKVSPLTSIGNRLFDHLLPHVPRIFREGFLYLEEDSQSHRLLKDLRKFIRTSTIQNKYKVHNQIIKILLGKADTLDLSEIPIEKLPEGIVHLTHLKKLYLGNCDLTELPSWIGRLSSLEELRISDNKITSLPDEIWQLSKLRLLHAVACGIENLSPSIKNLSHLEELDLSCNPIRSIPDEVGTLSNLQQINLSYCENLTSLPDRLDLPHCTFVGISGNKKLQSFPSSLLSLSNLEELHINRCSFRQLPNDFIHFKKLKVLNCDDNALSEFPTSILSLKQLEVLYCGNNPFKELPAEIGSLRSLKRFHFPKTSISSLPDSIGDLSNLRVFNCSNNRITTLPDSICKLSKLTKLLCFSCGLTRLPKNLGNLSRLKTLDCQNNKISLLPDSFTRLKKLQTLEMGENQITRLPADFAKLTSLQIVEFHSNKLSELPKFSSSQKIHLLDLSDNILEDVENICDLFFLSKLYLKKNQIKALPAKIGMLFHLEELSLDDNKLTNLPNSFILLMPFLKVKKYEKNPFPEEVKQSLTEKIDREIESQRSGAYSFYTRPRINLDVLYGFAEKPKPEPFPLDPIGPTPEMSDQERENENATRKRHHDLIVEFTSKLPEIEDFYERRKEYCSLFVKIIDLSCKESLFADQLYPLLEEGTTSCGDRTGSYFNLIYSYYCFYSREIPEGFSIEDLIISVERQRLLEEEVRIFCIPRAHLIGMDPQGIYFKMQVTSSNELRLPIYVTEVRFPPFPFPDGREQQEIKNKILKETADRNGAMARSHLWQNHIKRTYFTDYKNEILDAFEIPGIKEDETEGDYLKRLSKIKSDRNEAITKFTAKRTSSELARLKFEMISKS